MNKVTAISPHTGQPVEFSQNVWDSMPADKWGHQQVLATATDTTQVPPEIAKGKKGKVQDLQDIPADVDQEPAQATDVA